MSKIKFVDRWGRPGVAAFTQKPHRYGYRDEWWPTPAAVKADLIARGCTLTGKRQKKVAA